jgi:RNA polymerase sigma factor (sigma-70 family)
MTVTLPRARRGDVRPRAPQDSFALYLQEIGSHPLIGPEEERRLARRIRAGDRGALDRMVESNLRFVVSVARRYRHLGVPLQDLVTEGNLGLLEAAERFDERKGVRFTSYAVWWVRQSIISAIRQQIGIVRVPVSKRRGRLALERGPMPRRSKSHARDGETPERRILAARSGFAISRWMPRSEIHGGRAGRSWASWSRERPQWIRPIESIERRSAIFWRGA